MSQNAKTVMSQNMWFVLITNPPSLQPHELLPKLFLKNCRVQEASHLYETADLFLGIVNNCLILIKDELLSLFLEDPLSQKTINLIYSFPNSEILALTRNGTAYSFEWSIIRCQQRVRLKSGVDGEIISNLGDVLEEEKTLLEDMKRTGDYQVLFQEFLSEGMSTEKAHRLVEFEASWRMPDVLFERYLNRNIYEFPDEEHPLFKCFIG